MEEELQDVEEEYEAEEMWPVETPVLDEKGEPLMRLGLRESELFWLIFGAMIWNDTATNTPKSDGSSGQSSAPSPSFSPDRSSSSEPPAEIADMVRVGETYEQTNERLLPIYREAQNMKELANDAGDKAERVRWELMARKCDLVMLWMHGRMIEAV